MQLIKGDIHPIARVRPLPAVQIDAHDDATVSVRPLVVLTMALRHACPVASNGCVFHLKKAVSWKWPPQHEHLLWYGEILHWSLRLHALMSVHLSLASSVSMRLDKVHTYPRVLGEEA